MTSKQELAERVYESIDAMISAYAAEAVRVGRTDHRARLDMSEESVALLDAILQGQSTDDLEFQTRLWGSYFGETLRKRFGGDWELTQYPGAPIAVPTLTIQGSRLYPLMKVYRRLTLGESESLTAFYRMAGSRLKPLAPQ